jgi:RNA polymerase-binding transcription factor DksA
MNPSSKPNTDPKPAVAGPPRLPPPRIAPRWAWHHRVLTQLRDRLARDCDEKLQAVADQAMELHSIHPADSATDEFDHEFALTLLAAKQNGLNEIDEAIRRIEQGRYGICEISGQPIPRLRLRAVPWTRYTAEIESGLEKNGLVPGTRVTPAVPLAREGFRPVEPEAVEPGEEEEPEEVQPPQFLEFAVKKEKEEAWPAAPGAPKPPRRQPSPHP